MVCLAGTLEGVDIRVPQAQMDGLDIIDRSAFMDGLGLIIVALWFSAAVVAYVVGWSLGYLLRRAIR
jgi:hypothetical protein